MQHRWLALCLFPTLALVALSACGTANNLSPSASSSTLSKTAAGKLYLTDVANVDGAATAFAIDTDGWTTYIPGNALAYSEAKPLITAEDTFDTQLQTTKWPSNTHTAVLALINQNETLITDLQQLKTLTVAQYSTWHTTLQADTIADASASAQIRSDLGLPQVG